jgi:hypothetical protein
MMARLRRQDESKLPSTVLRTFVSSDFEDVQRAVGGLNKALNDMLSAIGSAKAEAAKSGISPTAPASAAERVLSGEPSKMDKGLAQIKSWEDGLASKPLNDAKKKEVLDWFNKQKSEFRSAANDDKKLDQLLAENAQFEQQWNK